MTKRRIHMSQAQQWAFARCILGLEGIYADGGARAVLFILAAAMTVRSWQLRRRGL